jgi:hypothetical protein
LDEADLVVGYPTGVTKPIHRHIYTWGYGRMVRALLELRVRDVNFSFKLVRRSLLQELDLGAETGFIDAQLLAEARARGGRRVEIPIPFQPRRAGRSHFDSPVTAWKTGAELIRYWKAKRAPLFIAVLVAAPATEGISCKMSPMFAIPVATKSSRLIT